jgi:hypothetical protein
MHTDATPLKGRDVPSVPESSSQFAIKIWRIIVTVQTITPVFNNLTVSDKRAALN